MLEPIQSVALTVHGTVSHGFFTRAGGVSRGVYGSLNCGAGSRDARDDVRENRRRVARHLGSAVDDVMTAHQVHSATALLVDEPWAAGTHPKADALVTRTRGLPIGALSADCTPVLLADPAAGVVAAAHAGWRGALAGVVEATLSVMELAGAARANIVAAVGPCIGSAAYEVGPEFEAGFIAENAVFARYFIKPTVGQRAHFDLPGFVAGRLAAAGVGRIDRLGLCTFADPQRFFSYRRTTHAAEADYGRQISAIMVL